MKPPRFKGSDDGYGSVISARSHHPLGIPMFRASSSHFHRAQVGCFKPHDTDEDVQGYWTRSARLALDPKASSCHAGICWRGREVPSRAGPCDRAQECTERESGRRGKCGIGNRLSRIVEENTKGWSKWHTRGDARGKLPQKGLNVFHSTP